MLLQAEHLIKNYGAHVAVNNLSLQIKKGSFTALLGPNGAGKSTTMAMLTGLSRPTAGRIRMANQTKIGVVFQDSVLDDLLTVQENLQIRAQQYRNVAGNQVKLVSQQLGLRSFFKQRYGTLSGGQKRRVDIARALLNSPDLLFLDEPTTGLDIQTRTAIWTLLRHLQAVRQLTVVLTTHYLEEADSADCVYVIDHGKLLASGAASDIKAAYADNVLQIVPMQLEALLTNLSAIQTRVTSNSVVVKVPTAQAALDILTENRSLVKTFTFRSGTMDDAFLALTGKAVR